MTFRLKSPAFGHSAQIPRKYTSDGANVSPPLTWEGVSREARELALICEDPDAPTPEPWVHWLLYKINPVLDRLPEAMPAGESFDHPINAVQGTNSWGRVEYGGPEPPRGHGWHRYHFRLFALDTVVLVNPGVDKATLWQSMESHIIAEAELIGRYRRD